MRETTGIILAAVLAAGALSGCARWSHFNKTVSVPTGAQNARAIFVDAKQRVVLAVPTNSAGKASPTGGSTDGAAPTVAFCAEPSPDALSALAATGSVSADVIDKLSASAGGGFAESAASIGLRTQSIQLMRDAMYRVCEQMVSGKLSSSQFETLHRRFQNSMVAILAIEQLTGVARGPAALLSGTTSVGSATQLADMTVRLTAARGDATAAKAALDNATTAQAKAASDLSALLGDKKDCAALPEAQRGPCTAAVEKARTAGTAAEAAKARSADADANVDDLAKAVSALRTGGTATSIATAGPEAGAYSAQATKAVADTVDSIVARTFNLGFLRDVCASQFTASIERWPDPKADLPNTALAAVCLDYAASTVGEWRSYVAYRQASVAALEERNRLRKRIVDHVLGQGKLSERDYALLAVALGAGTSAVEVTTTNVRGSGFRTPPRTSQTTNAQVPPATSTADAANSPPANRMSTKPTLPPVIVDPALFGAEQAGGRADGEAVPPPERASPR